MPCWRARVVRARVGESRSVGLGELLIFERKDFREMPRRRGWPGGARVGRSRRRVRL